ncbi:MAG: hypothetical protein ACTSVW_06880, partial [Candidatus Njordarchaeales archaeon]
TPYLSDTYTWASALDVDGIIKRDPPIIVYDELSSLPQAFFWSIILLPVFIIFALIYLKRF